MLRRKSNSLFDGLLELFMIAPLWLPLIVAAAVYFGLREAYSSAVGMIAAGLILLIGLMAVRERNRRRTLLDKQNSLQTIRNLTWQQFELLVGEAYRRKGYVVEERGGGGPDGGVDLVLRRDGNAVLVQCKHWKVRTVGVNVVREAYGVLMSEKASHIIIVTSGEFTDDAYMFRQRKPLALVNGDGLLSLVRGVQVNSPASSSTVSASDDAPACPFCRSAMILKTARRGSNTGGQFWGCPRFPHCRGTRQL